MKKLLKKLNEPFPEKDSFWSNLRSITSIGIFVTLFLYLLQPFGLSTYPKNTFWICATFGGITIAAGLLHELFSYYILQLEKNTPDWTLWKWILDTLSLVLLISIGNYLFMTYLIGWQLFSPKAFVSMLFTTFAVGIFPIVFSGMMIQMKAYQRNQVQAENLQATLINKPQEEQIITLTSQTNNQTLTIPTNQLFYLEAMQNYVSICFFKDGKIEKTLFRNTIFQMENQLLNTSVIRCHRSFIVNTDLIKNVAGNAQGLRLTLKDLPDFEVPVSRKYIPTLKAITS